MSDPSAFGFENLCLVLIFYKTWEQVANPGAKGSPQGMPNMASWVAPTLNIEELDKRIQELKTVQFWLEQNTHALKATIQALEVQKMTLSTLQGMNVNMADLAKAFTAKMPDLNPVKDTATSQAATSAAEGREKLTLQKPPKNQRSIPCNGWGSLTRGDFAEHRSGGCQGRCGKGHERCA